MLWDLDSIFIQQGQEFSIPIKFDQDLNLYGLHFSFQSDKVQVLDVASSFLDLEDGIDYNAVDSSFVLLYYPIPNISPFDYSAGTTLLTLTLRANENFHLHDLFQEKTEFPREVYVNSDFQVLEMDLDNLNLSSTKELQKDHFSLYPNPVNYTLKIEWSGVNELTNVSFNLQDIQGREVANSLKTNPLTRSQHFNLSIPNLSNGLYLLRISSDQGSTIRKILVQQ